MLDHEIDNSSLAALAQVDPSYVSRLRNGTLNQRNYIAVIRGLPPAARREYVNRIFFDDIPTQLSPEIMGKIEEKVAKRRKKSKLEENLEAN